MSARHGFLIVALLLWPATACDEVERSAVTDIGVTRLVLVDPAVGPQSVTDPGDALQVAKWAVLEATLDVDGTPLDLTLGESCNFDDTVDVLPLAKGLCEEGVIVGASDDPLPTSLDLVFTMQVRRAEPVDLPPGADFDGDAVPNESDNCPLIPNPDQQDSGGKGFGDACTVTVLGLPTVDSDGDGVGDFTDNCVWIGNSDQADTLGLTSKGTPDGIGDACTDQLAEVRVGGGARIEVTLGPLDFAQPLRAVSFLTVDFDELLTPDDCDWNAGACDLDLDPAGLAAALGFCAGESLTGASLGCP